MCVPFIHFPRHPPRLLTLSAVSTGRASQSANRPIGSQSAASRNGPRAPTLAPLSAARRVPSGGGSWLPRVGGWTLDDPTPSHWRRVMDTLGTRLDTAGQPIDVLYLCGPAPWDDQHPVTGRIRLLIWCDVTQVVPAVRGGGMVSQRVQYSQK